MRKRAGVLGLSGALLCVAPAVAQGATIGGYEWRGPPNVVYTAAPGEVNNVSVKTLSDGSIVLSDPGKAITIAPDATLPYACVPGVGVAVCRTPDGEQWINVVVALGDGDDRATVKSSIPGILYGDAGNDALTGGPLYDLLRGGAGRDDLSGAAGVDRVDFTDHAAAVTVTLDGAANDGEAGEADFVRTDVENVISGPGDDTLVGNDGVNVLWGQGGDDQVLGGGGDDDLAGEWGNDVVDGGAGQDRVHGGDGDDTLLAADGERDILGCDTGIDFARRDPFDESFFTVETCETVEESAG
jgi:Ca2+-binding RTX toxin-like protein